MQAEGRNPGNASPDSATLHPGYLFCVLIRLASKIAKRTQYGMGFCSRRSVRYAHVTFRNRAHSARYIVSGKSLQQHSRRQYQQQGSEATAQRLQRQPVGGLRAERGGESAAQSEHEQRG